MKSQFKKATAMALAMTMCFPGAVFAAYPTATRGNTQSGSFDTSFDVYSPTLHIDVPLKADIKVNPMMDSSLDTVKKFSVASNSLDIINGSVDTENNAAIPVNVTVKATITNTAAGVITEYNTIAAEDPTSTQKKIHLDLTEAATAATLDTSAKTADAANNKLVDLQSVTFDDEAEYTNATNTTPVTKYGSLLSVDIAGPTATGTDFTNPADVTPTVGSFAITGQAYTNANWQASDVAVNVTYNIKASQALNITKPTIATAPTGAASAEMSFTISNIGESDVTAIAVHKNGKSSTGKELYGDYQVKDYLVEYSGSGASRTATVKIKANGDTLGYLGAAANGCVGVANDLVVGLSDGRVAVSTLTVN